MFKKIIFLTIVATLLAGGDYISTRMRTVEPVVEEIVIEQACEQLEVIEYEVAEKPQEIIAEAKPQSNETVRVVPVSNIPQTTSASQRQAPPVNQQVPTLTPIPVRCTNNSNHSIATGNSGRWFASHNEAVAFYRARVTYWSRQWETGSIDTATYRVNVPNGFETWTCMFCGRWTLNFH